METCRYGWISNVSTAILRHEHHDNCAKNMTGFIVYPQTNSEETFDAYCYDEKAGPDKNCDAFFLGSEQLFSDAPAEPSELDLVSTQPEGPEETTRKTQPQDNSKTGDVTSAPGEDVDEVIVTPSATTISTVGGPDEPEASTEGPAVEENPSGGNENGTAGSTFISGDFDQPTGSGMLPPLPEEEGVTPTTSVRHPEETQAPIENERQDEKKESGSSDERTEAPAPQQPNDKERVLGPAVPEPDQQDSSGSSNWLAIVGVIVAVAAILLVCAAIVKRNSWCGKQQTLMITPKDGEGNGAAASASSSQAQEREQEMVTLMNKEKIQENGNTEEFTVITLEESPDKEQLA